MLTRTFVSGVIGMGFYNTARRMCDIAQAKERACIVKWMGVMVIVIGPDNMGM